MEKKEEYEALIQEIVEKNLQQVQVMWDTKEVKQNCEAKVCGAFYASHCAISLNLVYVQPRGSNRDNSEDESDSSKRAEVGNNSFSAIFVV